MTANYDAASAPKANGSGKVHLLTLDDLDGRFKAAQRAKQLIERFTTDLGGSDNLSDGERQLVMHAAVLGAAIESDHAMLLRGDAIDVPNYLSSINAQRRILTTLGLRRRPRDVTTYADKVAAIRSQVPAEVLDNEEAAE